MKQCTECGSPMVNISDIVVSAEERYNTWSFQTRTLYQCSKCKKIDVDT